MQRTEMQSAPSRVNDYSGHFIRHQTVGPAAAARAPWAAYLNRWFGGHSQGNLPSYLQGIPLSLRNGPPVSVVINQASNG